ncbi:MAG: hypothetical protein WBV94_07670 [Blastocatellia bacterium]
MDFKRCSEDLQHPSIVVKAEGRKFTIRNPKKRTIKKVHVDGCLIADDRKRCDFLFEIGQVCHCVIYLELKGSDIEYAFQQLVLTMKYLASRHQKLKKVCHIVSSRVPRAGPKVQNLKRQMVQKHKALLFVDTQESNINIEREPYHDTSS